MLKTSITNIERYIADLRFEGYNNVILKTEMKDPAGDGWVVKIYDTVDKGVLLDRNGENFMFAEGKTIEEALSNLNTLAA